MAPDGGCGEGGCRGPAVVPGAHGGRDSVRARVAVRFVCAVWLG